MVQNKVASRFMNYLALAARTMNSDRVLCPSKFCNHGLRKEYTAVPYLNNDYEYTQSVGAFRMYFIGSSLHVVVQADEQGFESYSKLNE